MESPIVTLALATYNQATLLEAFLDRFEGLAPGSLRLIVVDDGSDDGTPDLLSRRRKHPRIVTARIPHAGAAAARNEALRLCPTPWIAFTDTDCILTPGYFAALPTLPLRHPHAPAIEGAVTPPPGGKPPLTHWLENKAGGTFATANMLIQVSAAQSLGGFDPGFPSNLREDTDFGLSLVERFGTIPFCPELCVEHPFVPRPWAAAMKSAFTRQSQLVTAELRLFAKHPSTYGRVRRFPRASTTLAWWCRMHAVFYARIHAPWLAEQGRVSSRRALAALFIYAAALLLACWEQAALGWCYLRHLRGRP